jgi:hypothetical protein
MVVVDSGTKTHPESKPLIRIAHKNVHCPMERLSVPNYNLATPKRENPNAIK